MSCYSRAGQLISGLFVAVMLFVRVGGAQTYTNPMLTSQDPFITYVNGVYYSTYTAYGCATNHICIKAATTLTGLNASPSHDVWSAPSAPASNQAEVWAPELHYINNNWYIYYAADDGTNDDHRLFVLQASNSAQPTGTYVEGTTGLAHGQLNETLGVWAIDPDVFHAADGNLYITFSCTNFSNATAPQRICIAPMSGPLNISGSTVYLSNPDYAWEQRNIAPYGIEEGPVGYTIGADTYITFSASPSWIPANYCVGVLAHFNDDGTNPNIATGNWVKYGPILDNHGTAAGNGSISFVPSVDGSEYWALYHSHDSSGNLSTFMQQMFFTPYGWPVIGYPVNRGVTLTDPSGEHGVPSGSYALADWGNAYGDAAEGNTTNGKVVGSWVLSTGSGGGAYATSSSSGTWNQAFRQWNPNPSVYTASAGVQWVSDTGILGDYPKYGIYCSYDDVNNHAEMFIDQYNLVMATHAVVSGTDKGWVNTNLPTGFNKTLTHTLQCAKNGSSYTFTVDPGTSGVVNQSRTLAIKNGTFGAVTDDTKANFTNVTVMQYLTSQ
jgi:GH43 family beta-xylosidase